MGICGLTNVFTAQGRESINDHSHHNRAALPQLKPLTLTPTHTRAFWFQQRPRATPKLFLRQTVLLTAASQQKDPPGFSSTPCLPPSPADVLEASEKPVTLGPSPEPGHCQTRHT